MIFSDRQDGILAVRSNVNSRLLKKCMNRFSLSTVIAIALSTSVGFTCGYIFYASYGEARSAAIQAVVATQTTERFLERYQPILTTSKFYDELKMVTTPQELDLLRQKYRDSTLQNISLFEREVSKLDFPSHRVVAEPLLREAAKMRQQLKAEH